MPAKKNVRTDDDLARELAELKAEITAAQGSLPSVTREDLEARIADHQARVASIGADPLAAVRAVQEATPGTPGWKVAQDAAIAHVLASDSFAAALRQAFGADDYLTEAEAEPIRQELAALEHRRDVLTAEIELRAVEARRIERDAEQAEEERAAREHLASLQ